MVTAGHFVFILPKVMRPHPEWPEGTALARKASFLVLAQEILMSSEAQAASAALFLVGRLNRDGRSGPRRRVPT